VSFPPLLAIVIEALADLDPDVDQIHKDAEEDQDDHEPARVELRVVVLHYVGENVEADGSDEDHYFVEEFNEVVLGDQERPAHRNV